MGVTAGALLTTLLAAIIALALLAKKLRVPYPIVFVIGGALMALIPGTPAIALEPDLVFLLFLPPLIFGDGWTTDVNTFLRYRQAIIVLATGLVIFTSVCVAYAARWLIGFPLALGFVLGAILSPTDAVATEAIAEDLSLPRRLAAIISGESLVNDASGLVVYAFAVAAVVTGTFSLSAALLQFVYVVVVGLGIGIGGGLLVARLIGWIRATGMSDELIAVSLSLLTPFALYVPADALHASGVLAAMSGGMMLSRKSSEIFDADSRLAASSVWNLLFFTFNGAAFVLIGLQLRSIVGALSIYPPWLLASWSLGIAAVVIATRYVWLWTVPGLLRRLPGRLRAPDEPAPSWQALTVAGTAGMRGIVSLAAALALPLNFPRRELILFVVFVVIVVTLVGQGLLMPVLIRRWNIAERDDATARGVALAQVRMARAAQQRIRSLEPTFASALEWEVVGRMSADYEQRIAFFDGYADGTRGAPSFAHEFELRLRRDAFDVEREVLVQLRAAGEISDEAYREVEFQLDLLESRLA